MKLFDRARAAMRLFFMLIFFFSVNALAENKLVAQSQMLALSTMAIGSGNFVQRKYFKVLKHPIKSQGELYFDVKIGLLWQTNKPLHSALLLKRNGLFTENSRGSSHELKGASTVSQVLLSIMSGDSDKILQNFSVNDSDVEHCLRLTPKLTQLAKIIHTVQLCHGDEQSDEQGNNAQQNNTINHIVLHEHTGNRTEIDVQLTPMQVLPEAVRARLQ